jgi:hypothetical protein
MNLWGQELASAMPQIERLTPEQRYAAAVTAIQQTLESLDPPLDRASPDAQLLIRYLDEVRSVVGGDCANRTLPDGVVEQMISMWPTVRPQESLRSSWP